MKKLFAILVLLLLLLAACTPAEEPALPSSSSEESSEPAAETPVEPEPEVFVEPKLDIYDDSQKYEITYNSIYPKNGYVIERGPWVFGNKIYFTDDQRDGRDEGKKGNVFSYNTETCEIKEYKITTFAPLHVYDGKIYYSSGKEIIAYNEETGKSKTAVTFPENKVGTMTDSYKEYILYWLAENSESESKNIYAYNIETGESKLLVNTNHPVDSFNFYSFRIKNGILAYFETVGSEYEVRAISLETGENTLVKTLDEKPNRVVYNGEYLIWCGETGIYSFNGETEKKISGAKYDVDLLRDQFIVYTTSELGFRIYDLESGKVVYEEVTGDGQLDYNRYFSVTEDTGLAMVFTRSGNFVENLKMVYPDWNWDSDGQYFDVPDLIWQIEDFYEYPSDIATVDEMFNFGEGVTAIELEVGRGHFHIDCVLESEKYLLYIDGNIHRICDKETGEILHTENYNSFCNGRLFPWRADFCSEKEGFDYRILFTDRVIYRSTEDFTKEETVMLTEYIPETSEFYKKQNVYYDINGENTFVNNVGGSVVLVKEGEEPKVILEKGYFSNTYDFYKTAKGVSENALKNVKDSEYYDYTLCFSDPRFACGGTKIVVSVSDEDEGSYDGTVVYDLEKEKIEYCFYGNSYNARFSRYPIDDRYIQYRDVLWNIETGKSEKLPGTEFTIVPNSDRNLLLLEEGRQLYLASPYFDFKGYIVNRETGEVREFISTKDRGVAECYAVTENYYVIRVQKETKIDFYAVKFR